MLPFQVGKITLGVFLLLSMLFLYVRADAIYGVYAAQVQKTFTVYFFLLLMVLAATGTKLPMLKAGMSEISGFAVGFFITAIVMVFVGSLLPGVIGSFEAVKLAIGFGFLHAFVKAYIEEVVFRGILPLFTGAVISSLIFGAFHLMITGVGWFGALFLSGLGFAWYLVMKRLGLMAAVGSHFAYNLGALGILPVLLGVVS